MFWFRGETLTGSYVVVLVADGVLAVVAYREHARLRRVEYYVVELEVAMHQSTDVTRQSF